MIEYREAQAADIDELVKLRLEFAIDEHQALGEELPPDQLLSLGSRYHEYISSHLGDGFYVFVAEEQGRLIATAALHIIERPLGHRWASNIHATMMHVFTQPEHRRQGHALRLCSMVIEKARAEGAAIIVLEATESGRPVYLKLGFADKDNGCVSMEMDLLPS